MTELTHYLQKTLGLQAKVGLIMESGIPFYLKDRYVIHAAEILGRACALILPRDGQPMRPLVLRKDTQRIQESIHCVPILVSSQIDAYDRRKLIEYRVSFVQPGYQAYLPDLLIDAREHFHRLRASQTPDRLSPATQRLFLDAFYHRLREVDRMHSKQTGYSAMTRSRAIGELEAAGLAETKQAGRHRKAFIVQPWEQVWQKAQMLLRNPVKRCVYLTDEAAVAQRAPKAGFSALAELSMLTAPRLPVYAAPNRSSPASPEWWRPLATAHPDEARAQLELWSYPPLKEKQPPDCVDRLSLYLSLREQNDPRTREALDQLLKETL